MVVTPSRCTQTDTYYRHPMRGTLVITLLASCSAPGRPAEQQAVSARPRIVAPDPASSIVAPDPASSEQVVVGEITPDPGYVVPPGLVGFSAAAPYTAVVPVSDVELTIAATGCQSVWIAEGPDGEQRGRGLTFVARLAAAGDTTVTVRCGGQTRTRALRRCDYQRALEQAAGYYGESIDFSAVTLDYSGTISGASWTAHNRVSIGGAVLAQAGGCPAVAHYVHEFGHVYEYQHGQPQLTQGAREQLINLFVDVYDYGGAAGVRKAVREGRKLESFNLEQQAEIFADDFLRKAAGLDDQYARDLAALTRPALAAKPTVR